MNIDEYAKKGNADLNSRDFAYEVASLITEARLHLGLTQKELAELIGTQQPSIARIENGQSLPSLSFLQKIASAIKTELIPPRFAFMSQSQANSKGKETANVIQWNITIDHSQVHRPLPGDIHTPHTSSIDSKLRRYEHA